jgi:Domain of unknown function (DUF6456)
VTRRKQARPRVLAERRLASFLEAHVGERSGSNFQTRSSAVDKGLLKTARQRGLIQKTSSGWRLSDTGQTWLRRNRPAEKPFPHQHATIVSRRADVDGVPQTVSVNAAESPLAWLHCRKGRDGAPLISDQQYAAGERLRADFTRARLMPRVTSSWSPVTHRVKRRSGEPGGAAALLGSAIAARARVNKSLAEVGPELADILVDVCCFLKGLAEIEAANGWPLRSGKLILQLALTRLARHYGIAEMPCAPFAQRLRHWGGFDYRPTVDGV